METLYELRSQNTAVKFYIRKGSKNAFFPWQREPHLVAQFYYHGICLTSTRFAVLSDAELNDVYKLFNNYKDK